MDDFVAYTSRWRTSLYLLASVAGVAVGVWIAGVIGPPPVSRRVSPEIGAAMGWMVIAFCGAAALTFSKLWWRNGEQVRIGRTGIRWLRWCEQTIPWDEICGVTERRFQNYGSILPDRLSSNSRFIILSLRNPSHYPGIGLLGFFGKANRVLTGGDIGIDFSITDRSFDEAMAAIAKFRPVPEFLPTQKIPV